MSHWQELRAITLRVIQLFTANRLPPPTKFPHWHRSITWSPLPSPSTQTDISYVA